VIWQEYTDVSEDRIGFIFAVKEQELSKQAPTHWTENGSVIQSSSSRNHLKTQSD
jgi:hypothetical protein